MHRWRHPTSRDLWVAAHPAPRHDVIKLTNPSLGFRQFFPFAVRSHRLLVEGFGGLLAGQGRAGQGSARQARAGQVPSLGPASCESLFSSKGTSSIVEIWPTGGGGGGGGGRDQQTQTP